MTSIKSASQLTLWVLSWSLGTNLAAQSVADWWIPDGPVYAITKDEAQGIVYIGGTFTHIAPNVEKGALLDATTAQVNLAFPQPNNAVNACTPDGNGGWYIGGGFTQVGGVARNYLARINADGSLHPWDPNPNGTISDIEVMGDMVYIGGSFTSVGGETRSYIAAVDTVSGAVTTWAPQPNNTVSCIETSSTTVYFTGMFITVNGVSRSRAAAVDLITGELTAWDPNSNASVNSLMLDGSTVYVGGSFTSIGGDARNRIAALDATTGLATNWNPGTDNTVYSIIVVDNLVYVGGWFTTIGGVARNNLAAVDKASGTTTSMNLNIASNHIIHVLEAQGDTVYIGGQFGSIGGQLRSGVALLDHSSGIITAWDPHPNGQVRKIGVSGEQVYVCGDFNVIGGYARNRLAAIDASTGVPTSWDPGANNQVEALAYSAGIVYAGGPFTTVGGQARGGIAALDAVTGAPTAWNPGVPGFTVYAITVAGETVYVGGGFQNMGGAARNRIAAVDATTGIATSWNPNADQVVTELLIDGSTVYAGGSFTNIGGQPRNRIAALDAGTGLATTWDPNASAAVSAMGKGDGVLYVGGSFTTIGGQGRNRAAAIDLATGTATQWDPNVTQPIYSIAVGDSLVYVAGNFQFIGGQDIKYLAAVDPIAGVPRDWDPYPIGIVRAIDLMDGKVLTGGDFLSVNFLPREGFAAIWVDSLPTNEICSNALPLEVWGENDCPLAATAANTILAAPNGTISCTTGTPSDLWFRFLPSGDYEATISIVQGTADGIGIEVYEGCGGNLVYCGLGASHSVQVSPQEHLVRVFTSINGSFSICVSTDCASVESPVAEFVPIVSGAQVSFQNNSQNATTYVWDFGDSQQSTNTHPVHTYAVGSYEAELIASSSCGTDTVTASLELQKLHGFEPTVGGNTGYVTISLHGFGFDENTIAKLTRVGQTDITPLDNQIAVFTTTSAQATFDLNGAESGEWTLEVEYTDGTTLSASEPFVVEVGDTEYDLSVSVIGAPVIRGSGTYILRITNNSNIDATFVPVELTVSDTLASIVLDQELITLGLSPGVIDSVLWSFTYSSDGGQSYCRSYSLIGSLVPAGSSVDLPMTLSLPVGSSGVLKAVIGDPIEFDLELLQQFVDDLIAAAQVEGIAMNADELFAFAREQCLERGGGMAILNAVTLSVGIAAGAVGLGLFGGIASAAGVAIVASSAVLGMANYVASTTHSIRTDGTLADSNARFGWSTSNMLAETFGAIPGLVESLSDRAFYGRFVTSSVSTLGRTFGVAASASSIAEGAMQMYEDVWECYYPPTPPEVHNGDEASVNVSAVSSMDPNEKHGPTGLLGSTYHSGKSILYTIYFENVDTATAPAQIVRVLDSLDTALLDPASARLVAIGISDDLHAVPSDRAGNYFADLHYPQFVNLYTRVNFIVDTLSGVVDCQFISLDEATNEPITDPLGGFLPPNVTPPMGEGFIVISVALKDDVGSGVAVENNAAIIFDTNEPIITNTHTHITDFDRPTSVVDVLPDSSNTNTITVSWTSNDITSGVAYHNVYYKEVGMAGWSTLAYQEPGTQTSFTGVWGNQYSFFTLATDLAGNKELLDTNNIRTTVLWPDQLVLNGLAQPITCADSSDATLSALGIGGEEPYTYLWSTGDTTASIDGLVAGTYSVTVTDALGAQVDTTFVLEEPQTLLLSLSVDSALTCIAGSTTQITTSATGGVEPYWYYWGGLNFGPTLPDAGLGLHWVRLTDANGCVQRDSLLLESPSDLSASVLSTPANTCDGTIGVTPAGGVAPYTIEWADVGLIGFSLTELCPGTYDAILEDAAGCSYAISVIIDFSTGSGTSTEHLPLLIFPNPTTGFVTLRGKTDSGCRLGLVVRNAVGQELLNKNIGVGPGVITEQVDFSHLAAGTYFVTINCNDAKLLERLIRVYE